MLSKIYFYVIFFLREFYRFVCKQSSRRCIFYDIYKTWNRFLNYIHIFCLIPILGLWTINNPFFSNFVFKENNSIWLIEFILLDYLTYDLLLTQIQNFDFKFVESANRYNIHSIHTYIHTYKHLKGNLQIKINIDR